MASITVKYDRAGVAKMLVGAERLSGPTVHRAMVQSLGQAGGKTRTVVRRALYRQTGAKGYRVITGATDSSLSPAVLEYRITAKGKGLPIENFRGLRVGDKGVSASPWSVARMFKRSFFNRGYLARTGKARFPIRKLRGPSIPKELVKDQSLEAFEKTGPVELDRAVTRRLGRLLP